jgi:hypothetical protein
MALNIDPVVLNGSNYVVWAPYMETLLKRKGLLVYKGCDCRSNRISLNFIFDGKKDEL